MRQKMLGFPLHLLQNPVSFLGEKSLRNLIPKQVHRVMGLLRGDFPLGERTEKGQTEAFPSVPFFLNQGAEVLKLIPMAGEQELVPAQRLIRLILPLNLQERGGKALAAEIGFLLLRLHVPGDPPDFIQGMLIEIRFPLFPDFPGVGFESFLPSQRLLPPEVFRLIRFPKDQSSGFSSALSASPDSAAARPSAASGTSSRF